MHNRENIMKNLLLVLSFFFVNTLISQEFEDYYKNAMKLINEREFEQAHQYLDSVYKITNNDIFYYERAVIYYRQKDFSGAIRILEQLMMKGNARVEFYQLLGSCYDFEGEKNKSINILNEGLYKYPNAGSLYYELGVTKLGMQERQEAADLWEKGIYMDPTYDRNYYQLTKFYKSTDFKVVALFYGEIYINISNDDNKKQEISGILFDIYENVLNSYQLSGEVQFTRYYRDFKIEDAVEYPFIFKYHEIATKVLEKINTKGEISISMMNDFRKEFLKSWIENEVDVFYPNLIIDFQSQLQELGLIDAYNFMLLSAGNVDEITEYAQTNRNSIIQLINWQTKNRLNINDENKYFSQKYKP